MQENCIYILLDETGKEVSRFADQAAFGKYLAGDEGKPVLDAVIPRETANVPHGTPAEPVENQQPLIFRHGETESNRTATKGKPTDELNETGRKQAETLGDNLKGKGITTILSSDYTRARQTAELAAKNAGEGVKTEIDKGLREKQDRETDFEFVKRVKREKEKLDNLPPGTAVIGHGLFMKAVNALDQTGGDVKEAAKIYKKLPNYDNTGQIKEGKINIPENKDGSIKWENEYGNKAINLTEPVGDYNPVNNIDIKEYTKDNTVVSGTSKNGRNRYVDIIREYTGGGLTGQERKPLTTFYVKDSNDIYAQEFDYNKAISLAKKIVDYEVNDDKIVSVNLIKKGGNYATTESKGPLEEGGEQGGIGQHPGTGTPREAEAQPSADNSNRNIGGKEKKEISSPVGEEVSFEHAGDENTGKIIDASEPGKVIAEDGKGIKYSVRLNNIINASEQLRNWLESKKIDTGGKLYSGLPFDEVYNAALKSAVKSLQSAEDFLKGVQQVVDYLQEHLGGSWDKDSVIKMLSAGAKKRNYDYNENELKKIVYSHAPNPNSSFVTPKELSEKGQTGNVPVALIPTGTELIGVKDAGNWVAHARDILSRNFSVIAQFDPDKEQKTLSAAFRAASSEGTAQAWWTATTEMMEKKVLKGLNKKQKRAAITNFSKVIIQSLLNGRKQLYQSMSNMALTIDNNLLHKWYSDFDFANDHNIYTLQTVLEAFSKFPEFKGVDVQAAAYLSNSRFDELKSYLKDVFSHAASNIHDLDWEEGNSYEKARTDPTYLKLKEAFKPVSDKLETVHEQAGGFVRGFLGEENTYFQLTAVSDEGKDITRHFFPYKRSVIAKEGARNNQFATGFAEQYSTALANYQKRLTGALKVGDKNNLISALENNGYIAKWQPGYSDETMMLNDKPVKATKVNINEGSNFKPIHYLVPTDVYEELKPLLSEKKPEPREWEKAVSKVIGLTNVIYLSTPVEAIAHGGNLSLRTVINTPFVLSYKNTVVNDLGQAIGLIPFARSIAVTGHLLFMNPHNEFWQNTLQQMAEEGFVPKKYGTHTFSRLQSEMRGAKLDKPYLGQFGTLLYGSGGLDIRARMMVYAANKAINPQATPRALQRAIGSLGEYNPALQSQVVQSLKKLGGIAPFAVSAYSRIYNGIKGYVGGNIALEGASTPRAVYYRAMNIINASVYGFIGTWAATYLMNTGKNPFTTKGTKIGYVPLNDDEKKWLDANPKSILSAMLRNPKGGYYDINVGGAYGNSRAAIRLFGIDKAFETEKLGGTGAETAQNAFLQSANSFLSPIASAPFIQTAASFGGVAPYVVSVNDEFGNASLKFLPIAPPRESGHQVAGNIGFAVEHLQPVASLSGVASTISQTYSEKVGQQLNALPQRTPTEVITQSVLSTLFPQILVNHRDTDMEKMYMEKQRKTQAAAVRRYERKLEQRKKDIESKRAGSQPAAVPAQTVPGEF